MIDQAYEDKQAMKHLALVVSIMVGITVGLLVAVSLIA